MSCPCGGRPGAACIEECEHLDATPGIASFTYVSGEAEFRLVDCTFDDTVTAVMPNEVTLHGLRRDQISDNGNITLRATGPIVGAPVRLHYDESTNRWTER